MVEIKCCSENGLCGKIQGCLKVMKIVFKELFIFLSCYCFGRAAWNSEEDRSRRNCLSNIMCCCWMSYCCCQCVDKERISEERRRQITKINSNSLHCCPPAPSDEVNNCSYNCYNPLCETIEGNTPYLEINEECCCFFTYYP